MDCKRSWEAIYLSLDRELDEDGERQLEDHLTRCGGCARRRAVVDFFLARVRQRAIRLCAPEALRRRIHENLGREQRSFI